MLFHYIKSALRNILKYKAVSFINIFGLAVAMSVCMLVIMMLADQKSYDQFNTKKNSIYRVLCDKPDLRHPYATSPFPLATTLKASDPFVTDVTHLAMGVGGDGATPNKSMEMRGYFADPSFFNVFSFELSAGNPAEALTAPNSMVISAKAARYLFNDIDPIGKTIDFSDRGLAFAEATSPVKWGVYTVTGVLADRNYKSHLQFDVLVSASSMRSLIESKKIEDVTGDWKNFYQCYTYILAVPGKSGKDLDVSLNQTVAKRISGIPELKGFRMTGQKLTDISPGILLGNEPNITLPRIVYYFLSFLALVIMVSACLNYTNLSVARALTRAREIGVRKVNGALRKNILLQFLCESVIMSLFALVLSVIVLFFLRQALRGFWVNQYLHFDLNFSIILFFSFAGFALLTGLISGIYPALFLSGFKPIKALGNLSAVRPGKLGLRKVLSVSQFVISLFFIVSSILIYNQSTHFLRFKYGVDAGNIINVDLRGNDYAKTVKELGSVPGIQRISACNYIPATGRSEGAGLKKVGSTKEFTHLTSLKADENFLDNLKISLVAGKNFTRGNAAASNVLINETAVKELGFPDANSSIGQSLVGQGNDSALYEVIGVVKDFHLSLDHDQVEPLVLQNQPALFRYLNIKLSSGDAKTTLAALGSKWKSIDPIHEFRYKFFDDQLANTSRGFFDILSILGFLAFVAVTIACLGLLGMATYTIERRRKEIGIRKVLGAKDVSNAILLSREFINVLAIAICIAAPLSYIVNNLWLRKFPNRVEFGLGTILLGTVILLVLGLITIGPQAIRASKLNPVDTLRKD